MIDSILHLLRAIWNAFGNASPLANAVTILTPLITLCGLVSWFIRGRLKHKAVQIERLKREKAGVEKEVDNLKSAFDKTADRCAQLEKRAPKFVLAKVEKELADGNFGPANRAVKDWIASDGGTISALLLHRAEWITAHSAGDVRATGLVAATAYSTAAIAMSPQNTQARELLVDLRAIGRVEGQIEPPLGLCLLDFDGRADILFNADLLAAAEIAALEAFRRSDAGHNYAALPIVNLAQNLLSQTIGKDSVPGLRLRFLKARVLMALGHSKEALPIAQNVADAMAAHSDLGPNYPYTLANRYLLAQILDTLGRSEEALIIAQSVADAMTAHPDLGANHRSTLSSRHLLAQNLNKLGRSEEALPIAQSAADAMAAHPDLGPNHPYTLSSRHLLAQILNTLGRSEEALPIAQNAADGMAAHPDLGANHTSTLSIRHLLAQILNTLGRSEEAFFIAQSVADGMAAHPDLGPNHPYTLSSRYLLAQTLDMLGRSEEALLIAQGVADAMAAHPDLGANHRSTLSSHKLLAQILNKLGCNLAM